VPSVSPSLPAPRGDLSEFLVDSLRKPPGSQRFSAPADIVEDDLHYALYLCYELHYRSFADLDERWEWHPGLLEFRARLEQGFEALLFDRIGHPLSHVPDELGEELKATIAADGSSSLATFIEQRATAEQFREFVIHRSAYQLKEADPHTFAIPRISGRPKAALVEIQADEYGSGDPARMHSVLFADTMSALELDPSYGAYIEELPGSTLATVNLMSMFGLHRRWRGAIVGHLAAFEMTSAGPNRQYANGLRRLGLDSPAATGFYAEHVEADSVHENIAVYDLAEAFALQEATLAGDVLFGARALLHLDDVFAAHLLDSWTAGESSLRSHAVATT
jgi:hypothetical protein